MGNTNDKRPPLPHVPVLDPAEFEKTWHDSQHLLAALNGAGLGAWFWNIESGEVSWSRGAQKVFGLDPTRPLSAPVDYIGLIPEEERSEVLRMFQAVIDGSPTAEPIRHRIHLPDGSLRWIEITGSLQAGEAGQQRMFGVVRDITRQRKQEQALADSQERLRMALESADLGTWDWHIPSDTMFASPRAAALHGLPEAPFQGPFPDFFAHVPMQDRQALRQAYRDLLPDNGQDSQVTYRTVHANGQTHYLESTAKLHRDAQGQPMRMTGIMIDTSERTLREQRLQASERKFAMVFQASPDPICVTTLPEGRILEVNPAFTQAFGWRPAEVSGRNIFKLAPWQALPADSPLRAKILSGTDLTDERIDLHDPQGQLMSCIVSCRRLELAGQPCMLSKFRDITEQQRAESALKASQEKFYKAFHSSPDAITITTRDTGRYIEINDGFTRLTGYSAEEVIGRTSTEVGIWPDDQQRHLLLATLREQGHIQRVEMSGRDRHGKHLEVEISFEPIELDNTQCLLVTARDISELKAAQQQIQHLAYHDPLTSLPNRALLMDRLTQQIALLQRHGLRGALLFLDLDHFKHINDSLGHPFGDAVLKLITARLEVSVREEDTVARLGGDEFVVLLTGLEGTLEEVISHAGQAAEKLRILLSDPMLLEGHRLQVTPSIGIALIPDHGQTPADLLKRADIALYRAKDSGRNAIQLFHNSMQHAASERLRLENELRTALSRGEFELYFQAQVDARTDQIIGAEALLRWAHPTLGQQSPALFIHVLEESGLILEVGAWVMVEACHACAQLLEEGIIDERFSLCVNISTRQFRQGDFVERVEHCLRQNRLPKGMLKLEITEGIVIEDIDDTIAKMNRLRKLGVSFAMDDFGTGYSSLTYLKRLPVDVLKIDQSFVRDATSNPSDAEIIRAVVALGLSLGLEVIAEGVEQQSQLDFLQSQGCNCYQGYLFSRPQPLPAFRALLSHGDQRLPH
ncbi:EAL domain-containing protein [Pseudomonas sp. WHRI 8822A]|uniref:EAL domain-containing protein n=1 Tax=Pseudomonas sp. WHRI 8822A TaxID=3162568 RepID=UPI0032EAE932